MLNVFSMFFLFSFCNLVSKLSANKVENFYFYSQNIEESKNIRVWRYVIPRCDLNVFESFSTLGFYTEDDVIVLLQFLLINFKNQGAQNSFIKQMGVNFLLQIENNLKNGVVVTNENILRVSESVVEAYEYVVFKNEKNVEEKIKALCANKTAVFSHLFRYVGEISVVVFKDQTVQFSSLQDRFHSLKVGSILILEEKDCYKIYYINSEPTVSKSRLALKNEIKEFLSAVVDGSYDVDASDIEN
ncbi:hypothetical protein [Alphaproteobacteria bacterium endosymbiont of Tiliacea citrago]|uniref:hypothetical protein n=1 Tax=Alphaproteobacteria bacterium endosymbiont of Tiliacea citrago TaxID=3077944 RepID=UPI00313BFAAA